MKTDIFIQERIN